MTGGIPGSPAINGFLAGAVDWGRLARVWSAVGVLPVAEAVLATAEEPVATGESVVGVRLVVGAEVAVASEDEPGAELDTPLVEELVHPATRTVAVVTHNADQIFILDITTTG